LCPSANYVGVCARIEEHAHGADVESIRCSEERSDPWITRRVAFGVNVTSLGQKLRKHLGRSASGHDCHRRRGWRETMSHEQCDLVCALRSLESMSRSCNPGRFLDDVFHKELEHLARIPLVCCADMLNCRRD